MNTGLRRVVVLGSQGYASFEAMKWITGVGASLIFLDRRGKVIFTTSPTTSGDPRLRRAQAIAITNGTALRISRELISRKLSEQERVLREQLRNQDAANLVVRFRMSYNTRRPWKLCESSKAKQLAFIGNLLPI